MLISALVATEAAARDPETAGRDTKTPSTKGQRIESCHLVQSLRDQPVSEGKQ